jgi:hypothetical protein
VIVLLDGGVTLILWIALTVCLAFLAIVKLNQYKWLLLPLAMSVAVLVSGYADVLPKELGVVAIYVSTGDEEALILAEGKNAVAVDFSNGSSEISRLICDTATELRCTELQELILTHYHSRSSSQISSICGQMKLRILRLPTPKNDSDAAIAARLEQEAVLHGVKVLYGTDEPTLPQAQIVYYHAIPPQDGVEGDVLFAMDIYGQRVCYMNGGAWKGEFAHLSRDAALSSDLFIFGAHGRKSDVSADFFQNFQNTKQVIFGALEIYESCPRDALAAQYWVEIPTKQFSFQRTAHQ